jgi:regulator of sigma E protease
MEIVIGAVIGLVVLIFLVAVHELGHAVAARRSGVVVEEFGIGFPPRAWSKKLKNGMLFTLNWLPLGGFVRMQGEYDSADKKGDYGAATFFQKTKILLAGVAVNWIIAAILLTVLAWFGLPKVLPDQFYVQSDTTVIAEPVQAVDVAGGSPAEAAGLQRGDKILFLAGNEIASPKQLADLTKQYQGEDVQLLYERDQSQYLIDVQLKTDEEAVNGGYLGVSPGQRELIQAGWSAPVTGVVTTAQFSWVTLVGIKDLLVDTATGVVQRLSPSEEARNEARADLGRAAESVAGPIGILGVIFPAAAQGGLVDILFLTAIISLTLAVMNTLPIPALDGGRWATMAVFRLLRKQLTKEREEKIQTVGFLTILALIIVVTATDIGKLF